MDGCSTPPGPMAPRRAGGAAGRDLLLADMDQAVEEGAGGQHHGAGPDLGALPGPHARRPGRPRGSGPRRRLRRISRPGIAASAACMACAIELAVGLGPGPAHGRALAPVEQPELDAGGVGHPAHHARPAHRSRGPDGPCPARRWRGCRTSRRWSRSCGSAAASGRPRAPTPPRPRSRHARPRSR